MAKLCAGRARNCHFFTDPAIPLLCDYVKKGKNSAIKACVLYAIHFLLSIKVYFEKFIVEGIILDIIDCFEIPNQSVLSCVTNLMLVVLRESNEYTEVHSTSSL